MNKDRFVQLTENTNVYAEKADREAFVSGVLATLMAHVEIPEAIWQEAMRTGHFMVEVDRKTRAAGCN